MKLLGFILLAGLISLIAGLVFTELLTAILPCYSDPAGCGLSQAYRLFFVPIEVLIGMVVFSLAAFGKNREHPVYLTMLTLVFAATALMLLAWGADMVSGKFSLRGVVETLEVLAVGLSVIAVQWLVIRFHLRSSVQCV